MSDPNRKLNLSDELGFNIEEFSIVELEDRLEFAETNTQCNAPQQPSSGW